MKTSETIGKLTEALAKAQGQIKGALKDSENPFFQSRYADLESVWDACRGPLSTNGLSIIQGAGEAVEGKVSVETMLTHISGEFVSSTFSATPEKQTPQGVGSCITYLRRYGLQSIVGIAPSDDDGEAAEGRGGNVVAKPKGNTKEEPHGTMVAEIKEPNKKISPPKPSKKQQEVIDAISDELTKVAPEGKVVDKAKIGVILFASKGKYPDNVKKAPDIAAWLVTNKMAEIYKDAE